jgi:hypothetical protein
MCTSNKLLKGDRVRVGGYDGEILVASEHLVVVGDGRGGSVHVKRDYAADCWTVGGKRVIIERREQ